MSSVNLKRPTGVYIIALLFLLAPLGNILISFAGSGVANWYDFSVLTPFLLSIPAADWIWLGLLFITGILLFRPHKLSWTIAIGTLFLVLCVNAFRLYSADANSIDPLFLKVFSVLAIVCTLSILVIALYFRFPYLDRRANWFSNEKRFDVRTQALISGMKSTTESISLTGCRLSFEGPNDFKRNQIIKIRFPEISMHEATAEVVERMEQGIRVEFSGGNPDFTQDLGQWMKSRS